MVEEVQVDLMKLEWRNPVYIHAELINCEVNHPRFGWIPFTANPNDVELHGRMIYADIVSSGVPITPYKPPTVEQLRETMEPLSQKQMRLQLWSQGLGSAKIDEAIASLVAEDQDRAAIIFNHETRFTRLDPSVIVVLGKLGMTDEQMDAFWDAALKI